MWLNDDCASDLMFVSLLLGHQIFADIAGFTAWSSEREPYQVFKLLETIYSAFDSIAKHLGVFKVETIGDCYVAVTGLPDSNKEHAVVCAKFAYQCLLAMDQLTQQLELTLGPGTSELALRIGLHRLACYGERSPVFSCLEILSTRLVAWKAPVKAERFKYLEKQQP
jgi:hypothetical protein